jgi:hypothetical protein
MQRVRGFTKTRQKWTAFFNRSATPHDTLHDEGVGAQEVKKWGPALFKQSCSPINNLGDEASPIFFTATSKPIFVRVSVQGLRAEIVFL